MDFVGRYENLAEDFGRLTNELGVPPHSMGHQNRSKRKSSSQYYCRETKAIIEALYAEDFEYFDYPLRSNSELLGDS
jgi:hypothetical protein